MDPAVGLVQAYLHINGYFTVAEYPVMALQEHGRGRSVTDLDILAFRFPGASHELVLGSHSRPSEAMPLPDPLLGGPKGKPDMIVGEVKEGRARFNPATRDPAVLEVALARFGCCPPEGAADVVRKLLARGHATTHGGHQVRMVAFGAAGPDQGGSRWTCVPMGHVVGFIRGYVRENWEVLRHAQLKDPALSFFAMLEKSGALEVRRDE